MKIILDPKKRLNEGYMAVMLANALAVNQSTVLHLYCYEHTEVQ
jgi:hypothetical protein